jgi:hypothetical protein
MRQEKEAVFLPDGLFRHRSAVFTSAVFTSAVLGEESGLARVGS